MKLFYASGFRVCFEFVPFRVLVKFEASSSFQNERFHRYEMKLRSFSLSFQFYDAKYNSVVYFIVDVIFE